MRVGILSVAFVLLTNAVYAQAVPVIAKMRETRETYLNGMKIETQIREAAYYRTSEGITLEEWSSPFSTDKSVPVKGFFNDPKSKKTLSLDYVTRRVIETPYKEPQMPDADPELKAKMASIPRPPFQEKSIAGITCRVAPVILIDPRTKNLNPVGESCFSGAYKLMLYNSTKSYTPDGKMVLIRTEMFDVQVNVEPDPRLFDFNARGFTIYRPESP